MGVGMENICRDSASRHDLLMCSDGEPVEGLSERLLIKSQESSSSFLVREINLPALAGNCLGSVIKRL